LTVAGPGSESTFNAPPPPPPEKKLYKCGTLTYTKFGLVMVFVWLLWGDFVFSILNEAFTRVLPLELNRIGAEDWVNQVVNRTLGYILVFLLTPMVSFKSDRHRGRWGRRIPYLFWSTPFVGLFLVAIGCYSNITDYVTGVTGTLTFTGLQLWGWTIIPPLPVGQAGMLIMVLGVLVVGYDFASLFVNTVYWYLFNDVVPPHMLSRFLSLFRMVNAGAIALYDWLLLPHSLTNFSTIMVGIGIAYVVGFMVMCIFIKEGKYPPPPQNIDKRKGVISSCKTYAKECFTHRLYWYFFLANTFTQIAGATGTFTLLRNTKTLGLSLDDVGPILAISSLIGLVLQYPCGWAADKWNPIRVYVISAVLNVLGALAACAWCIWDFGPHGNLMYLWVSSMAFLPIMAVNDAAEIPMYMRLLPKERYGQFCSANAFVRALAMSIALFVSGWFMSSLANHMGDWHYRYIPVWEVIFRIPAVFFIVLVFLEWRKRGGDKGYTPPRVDENINTDARLAT
jgi:MFS family permease